ncbi:MAG: methylmalonyl Co-A mutase-associated GTPase MeaB [Candidatus Micrarchaeaceae archaeon]
MNSISELARLVKAGKAEGIARAISFVENSNDENSKSMLLEMLRDPKKDAFILGITGPPGCGKSTLIGAMVGPLQRNGFKIAVLAVDASSPISGGAVLGDRVRMQDALSKYGIYMRSMASRGSTGGLSGAVLDTIAILEAAGFDFIIVETVGAGQADLDIMNIASVVAVVLAPALGDDIQAIKAGLMEIGDIFVMNKSDLLGRLGTTASTAAEELLLNAAGPGLASSGLGKRVVHTIATSSSEEESGVGELVRLVMEHKKAIESLGVNPKKIERMLISLKREEVSNELNSRIGSVELQMLAEKVARKEMTPREALKHIKLC